MRKHGKLYAIVSVLAICAFALVFMGCPDDDGGDSGGGNNTGGSNSGSLTFTSIGDFHAYLSAQPANTAATPYNIKLLVKDLNGTDDFANVGAVLLANSTKYVSLDLYGVTTIPANIFSRCATLTGIIMSYGVTSIGGSAFYDCTNLNSVTISDSVINIGNVAFYGCTGLTEINVDSGNANYSSDQGILYNKSKTNLIAYPAGKTDTTFIIPNRITSIGSGAFQGCTGLTSVTIPNSVTDIGEYAFRDCTSLTSVTFEGTIYFYYSNNRFDGDLESKYNGIGTYTTTAPVSSSSVWTKR